MLQMDVRFLLSLANLITLIFATRGANYRSFADPLSSNLMWTNLLQVVSALPTEIRNIGSLLTGKPASDLVLSSPNCSAAIVLSLPA
jgi:hypothetical protein